MNLVKDIYLEFFKNHKQFYFLFLLNVISTPLKQVGIPHFYGKIIECLKKPDIQGATKMLFILLIVWISIQGLNVVQNWAELHTWPRFAAFAEEQMLNNVIDRYNTHFQELKTGEIVTKLIKLPWILDHIQDYIQEFFMDNLIVVGSNILYLSYHSKYLGLVYSLGIIVYVLVGIKFVKECGKFKAQSEQNYDECHSKVEDILSNLISVYTSKQSDSEKKLVRTNNQKIVSGQIRRQLCNLKYKVIFSIVNILIFIGLNFITLKLYTSKKISMGTLSAVFILNFNILTSLIMFYRNAKNFASIRGNWEYINRFLSTLPDYDPPSSNTIKNPSDGIFIEFKDIEYIIPNTDKKLYENFNLEIPENQSLVIMGTIGSGKSTFAKLLVGLQTPTGGEIFLNNISSKKLNIDSIRENVIYIPQSPVLFDRTLWENISYGYSGEKKSITLAKIYKLLDEMKMHDIRDIFEERMDEPVGKKGSFLSGGQRQVVWILRALLGKAKVIILDEPTSALDSKSKEQIQNMIHYVTKNRTLIIITHDSDLLENMDRLIVFNEGKIVKDKNLI
jgi:ABC-type bacteriocin/lantibiotic exporter with double-glycine peptidase domain